MDTFLPFPFFLDDSVVGEAFLKAEGLESCVGFPSPDSLSVLGLRFDAVGVALVEALDLEEDVLV